MVTHHTSNTPEPRSVTETPQQNDLQEVGADTGAARGPDDDPRWRAVQLEAPHIALAIVVCLMATEPDITRRWRPLPTARLARQLHRVEPTIRRMISWLVSAGLLETRISQHGRGREARIR